MDERLPIVSWYSKPYVWNVTASDVSNLVPGWTGLVCRINMLGAANTVQTKNAKSKINVVDTAIWFTYTPKITQPSKCDMILQIQPRHWFPSTVLDMIYYTSRGTLDSLSWGSYQLYIIVLSLWIQGSLPVSADWRGPWFKSSALSLGWCCFHSSEIQELRGINRSTRTQGLSSQRVQKPFQQNVFG